MILNLSEKGRLVDTKLKTWEFFGVWCDVVRRKRNWANDIIV